MDSKCSEGKIKGHKRRQVCMSTKRLSKRSLDKGKSKMEEDIVVMNWCCLQIYECSTRTAEARRRGPLNMKGTMQMR